MWIVRSFLVVRARITAADEGTRNIGVGRHRYRPQVVPGELGGHVDGRGNVRAPIMPMLAALWRSKPKKVARSMVAKYPLGRGAEKIIIGF
jgi:hypothetical protein